jgi:hypothetical protein
MSLHYFQWITSDIALADLKEPKFRPMDTADHTSNWFDREHFEHQDFELRRIQPSTLDQIWISQHTQWHMLQKQDPSLFYDSEQCLQAHTGANAGHSEKPCCPEATPGS